MRENENSPKKTKIIAVTAATGNLGSSIIQELKMNYPGHDILGAVRSPEKIRIEGTRNGAFNPESHFEKAAVRKHKPVADLIREYNESEIK